MCDGGADGPGLGLGLVVRPDFEPAVPITLAPVDSVELTSLIDNVTDVFMPDQGPAKRVRPGFASTHPSALMEAGWSPDPLVAEHGFAMLVTVTRAGPAGAPTHRILFDTGTSPDGVVANMRRLGIDPGSIEAIVCSHGHFDHTTGLDGLVKAIGRTNMPVLIHPDFWHRRRLTVPGRDPLELPTTSRRGLTEAGFEIIEDRQPSFLLDGSVLITGEVPRVTGYEPGFPPQQAWLGGQWTPDSLVLDDQALIINVTGKGLVVITGCGHAGVINICRYATRLTGTPLHAIIGGLHLNGPIFEPLIPRVLEDLAALTPAAIVPAHCTGWRATHALATRFADTCIPNAVGTRYTF
jgi:7,8-dihydropterin-6-yl-methyl-4-(beta-D-ribofuranosyl)aminobenzene 5'-phosphate synthase